MSLHRYTLSALRSGAWWIGPCVALAGALWARHHVVQASGMADACEREPLSDLCLWRGWVIQAFTDHRLSSAALMLGACGWCLVLGSRLARRSSPILLPDRLHWAQQGATAAAWLGLCVAVCGLVLYDAERSAFAALACALCAVQARHGRMAFGR
jgi:hypothetical protein